MIYVNSVHTFFLQLNHKASALQQRKLENKAFLYAQEKGTGLVNI